MKKFLFVFLVVINVLLNSFICYAATIPEFKSEKDNTILGIFKTSSLTSVQKEFLRNWIVSDRNLLFRTSGSVFYFVAFPSNSKMYITRNSDGTAQINLLGSCSGIAFSSSLSNGNFDKAYDFVGSSSSFLNGNIINGTILTSENISIPTPADYMASWQGDLIIRDDGGLFSSESESGGILEWLKNFWDSMLNFFKSIFIPEDGYFEKWYNEIKGAADKKFSALSSIFETLSGAFDSIQNTADSSSPLKIAFPSNHFYFGSPAITLDFLKLLTPLLVFVKTALTACVVIFTAITCYKYLIVLFEQ